VTTGEQYEETFQNRSELKSLTQCCENKVSYAQSYVSAREGTDYLPPEADVWPYESPLTQRYGDLFPRHSAASERSVLDPDARQIYVNQRKGV
jgi:hypothetical protein